MDVKTDTAGKTEILASWVCLYTASLHSWALYKTSNKETAEDLVQDTFLTAHQQFEKFKGQSNPKTWLLAILNNKIFAYYRKKYRDGTEIRQDAIFNQLFDKHDQWKQQEKPSAWHNEQSNLLDDREFNFILTSCLAKLPEHWQAAVNLKYIEQKKGELICQELDIAPTNFWQVLHRAKLQLRKCLDVHWFKA